MNNGTLLGISNIIETLRHKDSFPANILDLVRRYVFAMALDLSSVISCVFKRS